MNKTFGLINKLIEDGYVIKIPVHPDEANYLSGLKYHLNLKGQMFINKNKGGYLSSRRKSMYSEISKGIIKAIVIIIALTTVVVSIRQCQISKQAMEPKRQIDTFKTK